ncbi:MAG: hypothetical protein HY815_18495 [Candidatus Riflebacteria bacterium]|nr:hypothetical protein [Candidatus Riflebacteria bacterium]
MSKRTVLVIEDDSAIRQGIVDALSCAGYATCEASDGERGLKMALDRSIADLDLSIKGILYLWRATDLGEFKTLVAALDRSLTTSLGDLARLTELLDGELGRDPSTGAWKAIEESRLFTMRFPKGSTSDPSKACLLVRGLFSDLLYLTLEHRFNQEVFRAITRSVLARMGDLKERFRNLVADPDLAFPPGLTVASATSMAVVKPGQLAQYSVQVENRAGVEREVRVDEGHQPPDGWQSKVSQENFRLRPGESATVHYTIGVPYYAHVPMNHVGTLRIGWADEPGLVHQPQFLTRLTVGGKFEPLPGPAARDRDLAAQARKRSEQQPSQDTLEVAGGNTDHLVMEPGSVARYLVTAVHHGSQPRSVSMKLMTAVPDRWIVDIKPEEVQLAPDVPARFNMRLTAPVDTVTGRGVELLLGIGYTDDFGQVGKLTFRKVNVELAVVRAKPIINSGEVRTYYAKRDAATTLMVELANLGNVDDTFDIFVDEKPADWYVHLDRTYLRVPHRKNPVGLPITVRPPLDALTGEFERIVLRATSAGHPEIFTRQALTVAVRAGLNFALEPVRERWLVSPGSTGVLDFVARNVMGRPARLAFKVSPETIHPEWVHLDQPLSVLEPGEEMPLAVKVQVPHGVPLDRRFPVVIMALDDQGGEIVSASTELVTIPVHRIRIAARRDRLVRTRTLMMIPLTVTNEGAANETVGLILKGLRRYWAQLSHRRIYLKPGASYDVTLTVRVPPEMQYGQEADIEVQATSLKDGAARDFVRIGVSPPNMVRTNASTFGKLSNM